MGHGGEVWQDVSHWRREWQTTSEPWEPWEPHEQYEGWPSQSFWGGVITVRKLGCAFLESLSPCTGRQGQKRGEQSVGQKLPFLYFLQVLPTVGIGLVRAALLQRWMGTFSMLMDYNMWKILLFSHLDVGRLLHKAVKSGVYICTMMRISSKQPETHELKILLDPNSNSYTFNCFKYILKKQI